ncbi:UPF0149 family protein [Pseudoalteromonas sp. SSDWG2]|uniref:UPF0149 family protein n=1 Tax=Pseudoalteromonas sp. SSDWG2 TaxID=3139391 RepID=UPI003BABCEE1
MSTPFAQFDALAQYLQSTKGAMELGKVKGYLFALVCAPDPVEPEQWLQDVLGEAAAATDESILFALMNVHHVIAEQVYETGFNLAQNIHFHRHWHENLTTGSDAQLWASGFNQGVSYYLEGLMTAPAIEEQTKDMLAHAVSVLGMFSAQEQFIQQAQNNQQSQQAFHDAIIDLMGDFSLGFAELVELAAVQSGLFDEEGDWQG